MTLVGAISRASRKHTDPDGSNAGCLGFSTATASYRLLAKKCRIGHSSIACAHLNPSDHVYCAKQYIAWRKACDAVMPSSQFATFLQCYVDGEAIEQEHDKCFGVARCHGFSDSMNDPTTHEKYSGDKAALKPLF